MKVIWSILGGAFVAAVCIAALLVLFFGMTPTRGVGSW